MIQKSLYALLPEYVNQTLPVPKRWIITIWLTGDAVARKEVYTLQHLREAAQAQPIVTPSVGIWDRIQAKTQTGVMAIQPSTQMRGDFWRMWTLGMAMITFSFILLWNVLPPGVVLQWSAHSGAPVMFRIYRGISGQTEDFELLKEISADTNITSLNARIYTYRDFLLLPGRAYVYRVEVIDQLGLSTSQTIRSDAMSTLPGQLALILALILVAYGVYIAVQKPKPLSWQMF